MPNLLSEKNIQEALVGLYLRLNGYFTSGFIIHDDSDDPRESVITDVDILAVRFPNNREFEREILPHENLFVSNQITDFIIGEVKSGDQRIQFNRNLRMPKNLARVIGWIGRYDTDQTAEITSRLLPGITPQSVNTPGKFIEVEAPYDTRIRAIIFHLGYSEPDKNQPHFIGSAEIMGFIWQCLRPEHPRPECQTVYDFGLWGSLYEPIIRYFKDKQRKEHGTPDDLLTFVINHYQMTEKEMAPADSASDAGGAAEAVGAQVCV
jgi:hypothetical protein